MITTPQRKNSMLLSATEVTQTTADRVNRTLDLTVVEEETLVVDDRSSLTPAQAVENRLSHMLGGSSLPISHLQMRGLLRTR